MTGARFLLVLLAALLPLVLGWQMVCLLFPLSGRATRLLKCSLGGTIGLGLASLSFWAWRSAGGSWPPPFLLAETALWILAVLASAMVLKKRHSQETRIEPSRAAPRLLVWTSWMALLGGVWLFVARMAAEPHGRWDAWAMWNLKARFLARGEAGWDALFASSPGWSHPDYPLFLPATVARLWNYAGGESWLGPALTAGGMFLLLAGLLVGALRVLKGPVAAALAVPGLMGTWGLADRAAWQYADLPLALFMTASLACLALHHRFGGRGPLVLAGAAAGLAAWTKNEGLLFAALLAFAWLAAGWFRKRPKETASELLWMAAGALLPLGAAAVLKIGVPAPNDLVAAWADPAVWARLADPARAGLIARSFFLEGLKLVTPAALLAAWGLGGLRTDPQTARAGFFCLGVAGLCLAGYAVVYLATPHDLAWHLSTSSSRLLTALWPAGLLGLVLAVDME